jgi:hypothetical protein
MHINNTDASEPKREVQKVSLQTVSLIRSNDQEILIETQNLIDRQTISVLK